MRREAESKGAEIATLRQQVADLEAENKRLLWEAKQHAEAVEAWASTCASNQRAVEAAGAERVAMVERLERVERDNQRFREEARELQTAYGEAVIEAKRLGKAAAEADASSVAWKKRAEEVGELLKGALAAAEDGYKAEAERDAMREAATVKEGCVMLPGGKVVKDSEYRPPVRGGDGKVITVGSRQWFCDDLEPAGKQLQWAEVRSVSPDEVHFRPLQRVLWLVPELCYSTRAAAEAASKATQ
jgi:hypothetical protein